MSVKSVCMWYMIQNVVSIKQSHGFISKVGYEFAQFVVFLYHDKCYTG